MSHCRTDRKADLCSKKPQMNDHCTPSHDPSDWGDFAHRVHEGLAFTLFYFVFWLFDSIVGWLLCSFWLWCCSRRWLESMRFEQCSRGRVTADDTMQYSDGKLWPCCVHVMQIAIVQTASRSRISHEHVFLKFACNCRRSVSFAFCIFAVQTFIEAFVFMIVLWISCPVKQANDIQLSYQHHAQEVLFTEWCSAQFGHEPLSVSELSIIRRHGWRQVVWVQDHRGEVYLAGSSTPRPQYLAPILCTCTRSRHARMNRSTEAMMAKIDGLTKRFYAEGGKSEGREEVKSIFKRELKIFLSAQDRCWLYRSLRNMRRPICWST